MNEAEQSSRPQQESRVKKTLLNARVNLIFYLLTLCLSFFSRKIFLDCLGADFVGLTGTLQNLLGFLNLAELGIGSAIGYLLYNPIFDHDQEKINEIISVMGYLYRWIGFIIFGAGCILACFLPLIFPDSDTGFHLTLIYCAYFAFLGSSLIGYFINYRQNLLGADQRNYVVTAYFQTVNIIKIGIQMALAYYTGNLYLWVLIEFSFGIIYSFILNWKINQTYPWLKAEIAQGRKLFRKYPEVMTKTKQLFVHRISSFAQYQTQSFLIYAFVNLNMVALLGNYTLVIDKLGGLFNTFLGSSSAGVGNLIAEGNKDKILSVFWQMFSLHFFVGVFYCYVLYLVLDSFIVLWLGEEYLMPLLIIILVLARSFIVMTRDSVDQFLFGYGLFNDTWAPIAETSIYLVGAVIGGYFFGLKGILVASLISLIAIIGIWKPYFLFRSGFKMSVFRYWQGVVRYVMLSVLALAICYFINRTFMTIIPEKSFLDLILYGIVVSVEISVILFSVFFIADRYFREVVDTLYTKIFVR